MDKIEFSTNLFGIYEVDIQFEALWICIFKKNLLLKIFLSDNESDYGNMFCVYIQYSKRYFVICNPVTVINVTEYVCFYLIMNLCVKMLCFQQQRKKHKKDWKKCTTSLYITLFLLSLLLLILSNI